MRTVEQLRSGIDRGRARDKVSGFDPAAVPLGADDEAGGTPVTPDRVELAQRHVDAAPRTHNDGGVLPYVAAIGTIAGILVLAAASLLR
jgi:hypothetical protein